MYLSKKKNPVFGTAPLLSKAIALKCYGTFTDALSDPSKILSGALKVINWTIVRLVNF